MLAVIAILLGILAANLLGWKAVYSWVAGALVWVIVAFFVALSVVGNVIGFVLKVYVALRGKKTNRRHTSHQKSLDL